MVDIIPAVWSINGICIFTPFPRARLNYTPRDSKQHTRPVSTMRGSYYSMRDHIRENHRMESGNKSSQSGIKENIRLRYKLCNKFCQRISYKKIYQGPFFKVPFSTDVLLSSYCNSTFPCFSVTGTTLDYLKQVLPIPPRLTLDEEASRLASTHFGDIKIGSY